ncbi:MAG TPA: hypothetical protein VFY06_12785 [Verrucomicrobiae bacterium]|nr:hypothetical protein [Verrucomicrobiae bacterium]
MQNIQHRTPNIEHPTARCFRNPKHWLLNVECWMFGVVFWCLLLASFPLRAQAPPQIPPNALLQLQTAQPAVDVSSPVTATATFDPPVAHVGQKAFYRVTVDATESSIQWPDEISAPGLKFSPAANGQLTQFLGNRYRPLTSFVYELQPATAGHFTVTNFTVNVYGKPVEIPSADLEAVGRNSVPTPPARQLALDVSATNVFLGQPFRVRVMLPAAANNMIEALRETQLNGQGLMTDKMATRQSIETINVNGQLKPVFICEMVVTPIAAGPLKFSAQAFTAGRDFGGPVVIQGGAVISGGSPQYVLLVSDPMEIIVRPLPSTGELPGFTGAIGKFFYDPPELSTNRLRVGEPAHLQIVFHGEGDLTRLVPPNPPRSPDWQVIPDNPPDVGYTLIPLTDEARATPQIPFSYFDPASAKYVDLTIPAIPVTVVGDSLPVQLPAFDNDTESAAPLKLSDMALTPGKTVESLAPLQLRGWFVGVQLAPVIGFLALWQWDRRRRFLEAHPEIVRRRRARRALRREKRALQQAASAGDATAFVEHAANAMKISCAPHFPAHPQALVCGDVLAQLNGAGQNGRASETVRKVFAAADGQFAASAQDKAGCLALESDVNAVLQALEEKL